MISKTFGLSTSEARRLMDQGGVYIDGGVALDYDFMPQDGQVLQVGKRHFCRVESNQVQPPLASRR